MGFSLLLRARAAAPRAKHHRGKLQNFVSAFNAPGRQNVDRYDGRRNPFDDAVGFRRTP
jgi:hypothetical protein